MAVAEIGPGDGAPGPVFEGLLKRSIKGASPLRAIYVEMTGLPVPRLTSARLFGS